MEFNQTTILWEEGNGTAMPPTSERLSTTMIIVVVIELFLMVFVLAENGLIVLAFIKSKDLKKRITNFYLLQLAVTDFLLGLFLIVHVILVTNPKLLQNEIACVARFALVGTILGISGCTVLAITYDRFLAVALPFYYRSKVSKSRVFLQVIIIDTIPIVVFAIVPIFWHNDLQPEERCSIVTIMPRQYLTYLYIPIFLLLIIVKICLYSVVVFLAHKRIQNIDKLQAVRNYLTRSHYIYKAQIALARTGGIVVCTYLFCYLPFFINLMIQVYGQVHTARHDTIGLFLFFLIVFHSTLNPVIYVWRLSSFQKAVKSLLCCTKEHASRSPSVVSSRNDPNHPGAFFRRNSHGHLIQSDSTPKFIGGAPKPLQGRSSLSGNENMRRLSFDTFKLSTHEQDCDINVKLNKMFRYSDQVVLTSAQEQTPIPDSISRTNNGHTNGIVTSGNNVNSNTCTNMNSNGNSPKYDTVNGPEKGDVNGPKNNCAKGPDNNPVNISQKENLNDSDFKAQKNGLDQFESKEFPHKKRSLKQKSNSFLRNTSLDAIVEDTVPSQASDHDSKSIELKDTEVVLNFTHL